MVFISTVAATSFLPLPLLPDRNDLICNPCPPCVCVGGGGGGGGEESSIWVFYCITVFTRIK